MRDRLTTLWREATTVQRALLVGLPAAAVVVVVAAVVALASGGGSGAAAPQAVAATQTPAASATPGVTVTVTPMPTETPASAGQQAHSGPVPAAANAAAAPVRVDPGLSGPGPLLSTAFHLTIPAINVDASVSSRTVGQNGQMGNPSGPWDVVLYDFSGWPGLGGYPGDPGANAVFAGHVDYIRVGPAVFWSIRNLKAGDRVTVSTPNGPITYAIQWSQWADPSADFTQFVQKTGQDSITLVTCIGSFSGHEYSNRLVVRGVRV